MKKILLMGNPNVGKSAVFSRLTGIHIVASNYPGTTVEFTEGTMKVEEKEAVLIDAPGIYGLEANSKAEEIAVEMLEKGDMAVNVIDATNLERNLHLTLHLLEKNVPLVIALNMWDEAKYKGIQIDVKKLEQLLRVPVVPTVGVTGEGIKELATRVKEAANPVIGETTEEEKWTRVGKIVNDVQTLQHRHPTFLEWLGEVSVKPLSGIPIAGVVLFTAFKVIRFISEGLIAGLLEPLFEKLWLPLMTQISSILHPGSLLHSIVIGDLIDGKIDFIQSFGLLTTGLFVPIAAVLPYIVSFYLVLGFLEDFGYLPRLAVLLDNFMHRIGLHGWSIIPALLGLGCNASGILATRILESERERFIAATLISVSVPCAALQAMIWGLLGKQGGGYVGIVYLTLFAVWVILGRVLNIVLKGESPTLIMEVPPYRWPAWHNVTKKLGMRMSGFLRGAVPIVLAGVLVVNVLYFLKVFDRIAGLTAPVITHVLGLPKEAVVAVMVGFLRKDVAVGMLGTLDLTAKQLTVAVVVLSMFFPCIATFTVLAKELGVRGMLKSVFVMVISSTLVGGLLNLVM